MRQATPVTFIRGHVTSRDHPGCTELLSRAGVDVLPSYEQPDAEWRIGTNKLRVYLHNHKAEST